MSKRRSHKTENREKDKKKEPVSQNNDFDLASLLNMLTENLGGMEDIAKIITGEGFKEDNGGVEEQNATEFQTVGKVTDTDYEEIKADEVESNKGKQITEDIKKEESREEISEEFTSENSIISYTDGEHVVYSIVKPDIISDKGELFQVDNRDADREPTLLSRAKLQLFFTAPVRLPEPALECKTTARKIYLNSCHISISRNRIFLKGFIEENLEYSVSDSVKTNVICSTLKEIRIRIPFEGSTILRCNDIAEYYENSHILPLETSERFRKCEEGIDRLYYRVFSSVINEYDELMDKKAVENTKCRAHTFEKINRKVIWIIKLSLWKG